MRQTVLTGEGDRRLTVVTDDQGTEVLGPDGRVVRQFGTDRHEEQVAAHRGGGWRIAADEHVAPTALPSPPPSGPEPAGHPRSLVNDGQSS
jgi:hypothetical protein